MGNEIILLLMLITLIAGLLGGFPLGFVMGGVGFIFGFIEWGPRVFLMGVLRIFNVMSNPVLMAVPLFILMANFMSNSGIADRLFGTAPYLFGKTKGGLGITVILISTLLAACTGIIGASVTTMGLTAFPVLRRYKYNKELSLGLICAGGSLGILIPPSIMLVIMAAYTTLSVGQLFAAAFIPGFLLSSLYMIYILTISYLRPRYGPALPKEELEKVNRVKVMGLFLINMVPALVIIFGVLGSILMGIATATEAAAVGVLLTFILVLIYREFSWLSLKKIIASTATTSCMVLTIIAGAAVFTSTFFGLGGRQMVTEFMLGLELSRYGLLSVVVIIVFLLGFIMDYTQIIPLVFPIFLPMLTAFNFDLLWLVMLIAVTLQTCFLTPPVGPALNYLKGVTPKDVSMADICRGIIPFTVIILIGVFLCILFPDIILWLPRITFG